MRQQGGFARRRSPPAFGGSGNRNVGRDRSVSPVRRRGSPDYGGDTAAGNYGPGGGMGYGGGSGSYGGARRGGRVQGDDYVRQGSPGSRYFLGLRSILFVM